MTKNPFDFSDLSDLPEELAAKLHSDNTGNARAYADVVQKGAEAGYDELTINQIMAAATRMGIEVPTQQTVRGYLNKAVELGMISKPSRQTYGASSTKGKGRAKAEDAGLSPATTSAEVDDVDNEDDPLAGIV